MSTLSIEDLGPSKEDITERVIDRIIERLMDGYAQDEDGELVPTGPTKFAKMLQEKVIERANAAIDEIAGKHVLPNVGAYVENLCLQETNRWGEKVGGKLTFIEYLIKRAEHYLTEEVDYQGKPKGTDSFSWRKSGTRVAHLVHEHLQYSIETAMKKALADANRSIVGGIEGAVKIKLQEVLAGLQVSVKTK